MNLVQGQNSLNMTTVYSNQFERDSLFNNYHDLNKNKTDRNSDRIDEEEKAAGPEERIRESKGLLRYGKRTRIPETVNYYTNVVKSSCVDGPECLNPPKVLDIKVFNESWDDIIRPTKSEPKGLNALMTTRSAYNDVRGTGSKTGSMPGNGTGSKTWPRRPWSQRLFVKRSLESAQPVTTKAISIENDNNKSQEVDAPLKDCEHAAGSQPDVSREAVDQSATRTIDKPTPRRVYKSTSEIINKLTTGTVYKSTSGTNDQLTTETVYESTTGAIGKSTTGTVDKSNTRIVDTISSPVDYNTTISEIRESPMPSEERTSTLDSKDSHACEEGMEACLKDFATIHYNEALQKKAFETYVEELRNKAKRINPMKEISRSENELSNNIEIIDDNEQSNLQALQDDFDIQEDDDLLSGFKITPKESCDHGENSLGEQELSKHTNYSREDNRSFTEIQNSRVVDDYDDRPSIRSRPKVDFFEQYLKHLRSQNANKGMNWKDGTENGVDNNRERLDGEVESSPIFDETIAEGLSDLSGTTDDICDDYIETTDGPKVETTSYNNYNQYPNNDFNSFEETESPRTKDQYPNNDFNSFEETESPRTKGLQESDNEEEELSEEKSIFDEEIEPILVDEISPSESEETCDEIDIPINRPVSPDIEELETLEPAEIADEDIETQFPVEEAPEETLVNSESDEAISDVSEMELEKTIPSVEASEETPPVKFNKDVLKIFEESDIRPSQKAQYSSKTSYNPRYTRTISRTNTVYPSRTKTNVSFDSRNSRNWQKPQSDPVSKTVPPGCPLQEPQTQTPLNNCLTPYNFTGYSPPMNPFMAPYYQPMLNGQMTPSTGYPPGMPLTPQSVPQPMPWVNPWLAYGNPWFFGFPWWFGLPPNFPNPFMYGIPPNTYPNPGMSVPENTPGTAGFNWPTKRKTPRMTVYTTVPENYNKYNEKLCNSFDEFVKHTKEEAEKKKQELMHKEEKNTN